MRFSLSVKVNKAKKLPVSSIGHKSIDPYAENEVHRTEVVRKELNPTWNSENFGQEEDLIFETLKVRILDQNNFGSDIVIGKLSINLFYFLCNKYDRNLEGWLPIYDEFEVSSIPDSYEIERIGGLICHDVFCDGSDKQWIDYFLSYRSLNGSRSKILYKQSVNIESDRDYHIRGIGTAVKIRPSSKKGIQLFDLLKELGCNAAFDVTTKFTFNRRVMTISRFLPSNIRKRFALVIKVTLTKDELCRKVLQLPQASLQENCLEQTDESANRKTTPNIVVTTQPDVPTLSDSTDIESQNLDKFQNVSDAINNHNLNNPANVLPIQIYLSLATTEQYLFFIINHMSGQSIRQLSSSSSRANEHCKSIVFASYEIALLLARKRKPFTNAEETIKPTLKIVAGMLDDKNCDKKVIRSTYQIIRLPGEWKRSDRFETLKNLGEKNNMERRKLVSICTDEAPAMEGSKLGCLTLIEQFLEALCGKTLNLKYVMDFVVRCVNEIRSSALNRREFRQFLYDMNEEYGELRLHCEVRWLSKGRVLIYLFLSEKDELQAEREYILNDDWLNDLAFMVDIKLDGKDKLFTNLCDEVYEFKMKLRLFIRQLREGILDAFPTLKARLLETKFNVLPHQITLESLLEAFESRFDEFEKEKDNVALFTNPFLFPESKIFKLHENLQLGIFELTCNSIFQSRILQQSVKLSLDNIISFWQQLPTEQCEQSFAAMTKIKNKQRLRLTDSNLSAGLILGTTSLCPDIEKLTLKQN
ncbi:hypothetical protein RF11_05810 [Thelohanellus kitauei]|uniref:C2 domain-containing protein n=1 Tax=Thelohanellus kitauei TaxID=669202 RepID=A0A0C2I7D3_THEKT|nr:hypothetical protein RF11_05810 [Thelohanellus kitauei]